MLSVIYVNQGDYAKGEAELERLLERFPEDPGCNNDLGYLYADQGKNLEKAEAMIRKALVEEADERAYLDSLGWVLFKRGKLKEALEPLEKAAEKIERRCRPGSIQPGRDDPRASRRRLLPAPGASQGGRRLARGGEIAAQAVPVERRLPEIRKKLGSLEKLGPIPKSPSTRTP